MVILLWSVHSSGHFTKQKSLRPYQQPFSQQQLQTKNIKNEPFEPKKWASNRPTKSQKMYLHRIFYCRLFRKNELNICSYKYKNRLTTTRTKVDILICSLWHLLEVVFRSSEVVQIEHCRATRSPLGNKLKDAVVLYVPMIDLYRSPQRATTNYSKIGLTNCISPKMST